MRTLIQQDWCTSKKKGSGHRHSQRDEDLRREGDSNLQAGERPREKPTLLTPLSWISSLQNCEKTLVNFCCVNHLVVVFIIISPSRLRHLEIRQNCSNLKPPPCPHSTFVRYFIFIKDSFTLPIWYCAIHFFYSPHKCIDKYLLCTYYPPSSFLGARETEENKTQLNHMFPSPKKDREMERVT